MNYPKHKLGKPIPSRGPQFGTILRRFDPGSWEGGGEVRRLGEVRIPWWRGREVRRGGSGDRKSAHNKLNTLLLPFSISGTCSRSLSLVCVYEAVVLCVFS